MITMEIDSDDEGNDRRAINDGDMDDTDDDQLMIDDVNGLEQLNFDFEAYPMNKNDKESIINLLTQIFLRADIDLDRMANILIEQSPFGCVYRVAEEFINDEDDDIAYGVLSMLKLGHTEKYENDLWNLLKTRVHKYAIDKKVIRRIDELSMPNSNRSCGLLINERMLHFPAAIAAPAFTSLQEDLKKSGLAYRFTDVIMILKIRIADSNRASGSAKDSANGSKGSKKKMSKAQKRREAVNAAAESDVMYDNSEEELLFKGAIDFDYFQYPVQSELEKESKFNSTVVNGTTYRPYRRVCLLNSTQLQNFITLLSQAQGL